MSSSPPASLFLLSLVFCQFVSAAGQKNVTVKAEPGDDVILPCKSPDQERILVAEWSRTDLGPESVLLYRNFQFNLAKQNPSYKDRVDLLVGQINKGDVSLILKNTTTDDRGKYECRVVKSDLEKKLISSISLHVAPRPPEPFPVWVIVLLVLLVLALVAAAVLSFYFWLRRKPDPEQTVEVESGEKFVKLPFKVPRCLWFIKYRTFLHVDKVEWKDGNNRTVHVYQNGSDQPGEQNLIYKDRTKMDKNLLKTGDLSLTLIWPIDEDENTFTCTVYNKNGEKLMMKNVWLKVKVPEQVEVESGVESVLLPCRTTENLDENVKVEWKDKDNRTVHVYPNGSDQPGEQNQIYRTRTKMDENLLKTKDLSLTLKWPRDEERGIYTCSVYRDRKILMKKQINLKVEVQQVEVKSGVESVELPWITTEDLDGDVKVEWKDKYNRTVHVYQNGSDQPGEQNQIYRTRTKMDGNLLKTKDLSLTLICPRDEDRGIYRCRVYKDGNILMEKQINLQVKVQQVVVEPGVKSVLLPWRITEDLDGDVKVEWRDEDNRMVHVYQNGSDQPGEQNQIYRTRTKMDGNLLENKNLSLTLRWPTERDTGIYTCRVYNSVRNILMMKQVNLKVKVPEQVEVESGVESVKLPWEITENLGEDVKVEWMDKYNRTVHVYQNGSDQPGEQNQIYRTRTKMDENLLENKNLSLTLKRPRDEDRGIYTCRVYRDGVVLMIKEVLLQVEVPQVKVEPGVESVLLPWRIREDLDEDVRVEWRDEYNDVVHVYQNGSDQPGEQNQIYRTRTKMDGNLLENKNLSLTLMRPTERDFGTYTCRVYKDGNILMKKQINLEVEVPQVEVESGVESVLLPWIITENLDGVFRVEWKDRDNDVVHVYQNGYDQPGEQNQIYRTRTKMDENLKNKNLSLTLMRPTERDTGIYTCRVYNSVGNILLKKQVNLKVKGTVQNQPEDTRTRSNPTDPLMDYQSV